MTKELETALEQALTAQKEATAAVETIRNMIENKPFEHDVLTPVSGGGRVLFSDLQQRLRVNSYGRLSVTSSRGLTDDRSMFKWVQCKREDLVAGDVAYSSDLNVKDIDFADMGLVRTIVNKDYHYIACGNGSITKSKMEWRYWFKLTPRN